MRFTDRSIAALKPKAALYEVWEDGRTGLGVRMSPTGRKSWNFMYRFGGKARRMTLGTYPTISKYTPQPLPAQVLLIVGGGEPSAKRLWCVFA